MQKKQLIKIKDFFSHEMVRNRTEKNLTQQDMADLLDCSKRTLQRLENPSDLDCTFSSAIQNFARWASVSNYSLKDWFIKVCCPSEDVNFRATFKWEVDLITAIAALDPHIRRSFTKQFDAEAVRASKGEFTPKLDLVILIANYLLNMTQEQLLALLVSVHFSSDEATRSQFRDMVKKYINDAQELI